MITHYFNFQLGQVIIRSGKTRIRVGLGSVQSCSGWNGSGINLFGFHSVRVISGSGLHRVKKIWNQFGSSSSHFGFRVKSSQHGFGLVHFWISGRDRFNSFE